MKATKIKSIRTKLLLRLSLLLVIVFSILWVIVAERSYTSMYSSLDEAVRVKVDALTSLLSFDPEKELLRLKFDPGWIREFSREEDEAFFQIQNAATGTIYFLSPSTEGKPFESPKLKKLLSLEKRKRLSWNDAFHGENVRCIRSFLTPRVTADVDEDEESDNGKNSSRDLFASVPDAANPPVLEIILGMDREKVDRRYAQILGYTAASFVLVLLIVFVLTHFLLKHSLRSLTRLTQQVDQITTLPSPITLAEGGERETATLSRALTSLLKRLGQSIEWERQMTANIAHELRTPLSALRNVLEISLSRKRSVDDYAEALTESLGITHQMQRLIENLLQLARLESGQAQTQLEPIFLGALIHECWSLFQKRAEAKQINLRISIPDDVKVVSDRDKLRIIFNNLFDNAIEYTSPQGRISVDASINKDAKQCELEIANSGEPLSAEELENISKRFHRQDTAREAGLHFGLGLSLVESLSHLLGIEMRASSSPGVALSLTLRIPLATNKSLP